MSTVADTTKQLKQRYSSSRFAYSSDEWPPYQPKHYTTLAFIHNKGKHADRVRFFVQQQGKLHTSQPKKLSDLNASMTKNISEIFLPVKSNGSIAGLHVLIEGAPGIGKTVLTKEITYQWAKNILLLSTKLVLLVFLRECSQIQLRSINELVKHVFKNDEMISHLTNYLSNTEGNDTIIIIDGFDELSEGNRKESIIVDIINCRILTRSCVVVTSRPTVSSDLHGFVDRRIEIVGFTEEDRLDYIKTALESSTQVKALQHYLQSNPTINALCYIPLNMTILLCLAENGLDTLPKIQTEMYKKFIQMTIIRFIKKYDDGNSIINVDELPHPHDKVFIELAKLAYEALQHDKIIFTLSEIEDGCPHLTMTPSNWNGLGLLKAVHYFSAEMANNQVTFNFLHFSIQEYMAAWHISKLPDKKQIKLLEKTFWEYRYYNTWIMYVGITGGNSYALRSFLSGMHNNLFQLFSKFYKTSKIRKEYLHDKMKCLHLFQCLHEANKEDDIKSVTELLENKIDLSDQTLLPSDLDTLSFFLIRSINKEWDELNLSCCNIDDNGSNILCDRFLDKDIRSIVTIKMVNFSYNRLSFSCLIRLFDLFNSWYTSEIVITDDTYLDTSNIKAIEDMVFKSSTLALVIISSYLFCKNLSRLLDIHSNTEDIKSISLLNCGWESNYSRIEELLTWLEKQKPNIVCIIGPSVSIHFIERLILKVLKYNNPVNMFIYDPDMSDQTADRLNNLISNMNQDVSGIMLIVSSKKVQGKVKTCSLSNELSPLNLLNLKVYVKYFNTKVCWYRANLDIRDYNKDGVIEIFRLIFYKMASSCQLKITLVEKDTLIAYQANLNEIVHSSSRSTNSSSLVCSNRLINIQTFLILNNPDFVDFLYTELLNKQIKPNEIFIYQSIKESHMDKLIELISGYHHKISAVLVGDDILVTLHPSNKQIALALQLQPSITAWILSTTDNSIVHKVIDMLTVPDTTCVELDLTGCNLWDTDYEHTYNNFRSKTHLPTMRKLKISLNKLTESGIYNLMQTILIWGVQELTFNGSTRDDVNVFYNYLIYTLTNECTNHRNNLFLSVIHNHQFLQIVCNARQDKISTLMVGQATEMYIINSDLQISPKVFNLWLNNARKLLKLCVIKGTVSETILIEAVNSLSGKTVELSIGNARIVDDDRKIWSLISNREFYCNVKSSLVLSTNQWLCVSNVTNYQLHLIHMFFLNQTQPDFNGMNLLRNLVQIKGVCIFENEAGLASADSVKGITTNSVALTKFGVCNKNISAKIVDGIATDISFSKHLQELTLASNDLQTSSTTKIFTSLQKNSSLTKLYINHNNITDEAATDIANVIACNTHLQELSLSNNYLQASGTIKIAKSLQKISSLTKLYINHNNITDEATNDIAAIILCNVKLQEFDVSGNKIQINSVVKIMKALKSINSLRGLYISNSNITDEAADDIVGAILCNPNLQIINISENNLQTKGAVKISKALQEIITLKAFCFNNNNCDISDKTANSIAKALVCSAHLQELEINNNSFQSSHAIIQIAEALQCTITLTKLCLNNNNITDEAANDIASGISCNNNLQVFDIGSNNLQAPGAIKIAKSLQKISTLKVLYLNDNNITDEAASEIAHAISCNIYLQEFNIDNNPLTVRKVYRRLQH